MSAQQLGLDFSAAAVARDEALERIECVVAPTFRSDAERFILAYLGAHGPTAGELLVEKCVTVAGLRPTDRRHFGVAFRTLSMRGAIRCVGFCNRSRGHNTAGGRIWELATG